MYLCRGETKLYKFNILAYKFKMQIQTLCMVRVGFSLFFFPKGLFTVLTEDLNSDEKLSNTPPTVILQEFIYQRSEQYFYQRYPGTQ